MRPINNNYLSVDAKDIVDKHDHPRAMYKWSNKDSSDDNVTFISFNVSNLNHMC